MKRRTFLQFTSIGGLSISSAGFTACSDHSGNTLANSSETISDFALDEITVDRLQQSMADGSLTARSVVEMYLQRIEQIDRSGPRINSVIEVNPDALSIAETLDKERAAGNLRGPLHGIPVIIKDNIDTADKMMTTAGTLALQGNNAKQDSWVAQKLREAGAIILAKANLSEWANFRSSRSSSGWSGRGGQTNNPYVLGCNPCGSSSGSGAAVAANLCTLAIGTETNGSVICPSSVNGVVGIKPTVGLIGRSGIIPISESQDTAGPMARTVRDAALLLGALTGIDPQDPYTQASQDLSHKDYTVFLDDEALKGARIGVDRSAWGYHEGVDQLMGNTLKLLSDQGAELIDLEQVTSGEIGGDEFNVLLYEFKDGVNKYLAGTGDQVAVRSLREVIEFNLENASSSMPFFGQEILLQAAEKGGLDSAEYLNALENVRRITREEGIDKVMDENDLLAIIAPSEGPAWTTDKVNGDRYISNGRGYQVPAMAGYPNITVPAGFIHDLPIGLSFYGRAWSEPVLLGLAFAFEQAGQHRKKPTFLTKLGEG